MRIPALFLLYVLCLNHSALCQDIITQKNGTTTRAKVLKITPADIEYKLYDYQEGPLHTILKSDVSMVTYENGTTDTFSGQQNSYDNGNTSLFNQGMMDAKMYYKPPMTGSILAGVGTIFFYGFIPAIVSYNTPPRYENLHFPYPELMDKYEYREAYMQKAYQIKRARTAEGFGIGIGSVLCLFIAGTIISMNH